MLALAGVLIGGCDVLKSGASGKIDARYTGRPRAKPAAATAIVPLAPGCPLGATATLGLQMEDKGCRSLARTVPAGPVGTPGGP